MMYVQLQYRDFGRCYDVQRYVAPHFFVQMSGVLHVMLHAYSVEGITKALLNRLMLPGCVLLCNVACREVSRHHIR